MSDIAEVPDRVRRAMLMLDRNGAWTGIDRPFTGWLATVPHLVEGHNFELSATPVCRRARLTEAGKAYLAETVAP